MLILHHDPTSPASAVATLRLQQLAAEGGAVAFQGFDTLGLDAAIPVTLDQLAELDRVGDRLRELGVDVRRPIQRPPTLAVHLVADLADPAGLGAAWRTAVIAAYWERGADLADDATLSALAGDAGLDTAAVSDLLADRGARIQLRRRMLATRQRGIGGVPVLEVDGTLVSADLPDADLRQLAGV
ncbi:MAG: DsbA family protein [Nitriliruptor sp.]|uniref:DsbA family protein n=1 Tax=Nitriliruptor sp. TaxID=2448056 RepID=UPI0034A0322F